MTAAQQASRRGWFCRWVPDGPIHGQWVACAKDDEGAQPDLNRWEAMRRGLVADPLGGRS